MPTSLLTRTIRFLVLAGAVLACFGSLNAASILYYEFDGTAGETAGTIQDSTANGLNGQAGSYGGGGATTPVYSNETVGPVIISGIGGTVVNSNNTTSLKFDNPGVANGNYATNAGGRVTVPTESLLRPANFTIEAFVKVEDLIQFAGLIGHERDGGSTWLFDTNPNVSTGGLQPTNMNLRARVDHQEIGATAAGGTPGFNQSFSSTGSIVGNGLGNGWNHVAMTYDDTDNRVTLYLNYEAVGTGVLSTDGVNDLVYQNGTYSFFIGGGGGGRGFDGWIDEVRFSDSILTSDEFLRVVPEPGKAVLMGLAGVFFVLRRKRQRQA